MSTSAYVYEFAHIAADRLFGADVATWQQMMDEGNTCDIFQIDIDDAKKYLEKIVDAETRNMLSQAIERAEANSEHEMYISIR